MIRTGLSGNLGGLGAQAGNPAGNFSTAGPNQAQWQHVQQFQHQAPTEPKWPNQMCEILAEAGRLLLEENKQLKARVAELEAIQAEVEVAAK